jgi:elongation factor G
MDRTGADFYNVVKMVKDRLGAPAVPIQIPIGAEGDFKGVIDLVEMNAIVYTNDDFGKAPEIVPIPESLKELADEFRIGVVEAAAEHSDVLMEKYLSGVELTRDEIVASLRQATIDMKIYPMLCGTAFKNKGIQPLLDCVIHYLPSPLDVEGIEGINPDTEETNLRLPSDDEPFSALAFKLMNDQHVGNLTFFRVYSGTITKGSYVYNATKGKKERISRIVQMHANKREEIDQVYAGDIAAAVGLSETTTGDTICEEKSPIILESMSFPDPVIEMSIEPKTKADQDKMGVALSRLAAEDPTFRMYTDVETGRDYQAVFELVYPSIKSRISF